MNSTKRVNLALQGGGSHGAFTWGVLDALIEEGRLVFEAGTMAVASPIQRTPLDRLQGNWNLDDSPGALWADLIQRTLTPWQRNPLKFDPLRELLRRHFDERAVRACQEIKAFIAATNVQTGKVRIFTREELSIDALLASACLPNVHDAVVIDGVPYWDGGFPTDLAIHLREREQRCGSGRGRSAVPRRGAAIQRRERRPGLAGAPGRGQQVQRRAEIPEAPVRSWARGRNLMARRVVRLGR